VKELEHQKAKHKAYKCFVCNKEIFGNIFLMDHMKGKKHCRNLENLKNCVILEKVLNLRQKKPILGLEYLVELANVPEVDFVYVCLLCRVEEKDEKILDHFCSRQHIEKFVVSWSGSLF
jgi:hypothetical protein